MEITKCREQMSKIQEDIDAENTRLAESQARVMEEQRRLEAESLNHHLHQNKLATVHQSRFQSRLPVMMDPARLFMTLAPMVQGPEL